MTSYLGNPCTTAGVPSFEGARCVTLWCGLHVPHCARPSGYSSGAPVRGGSLEFFKVHMRQLVWPAAKVGRGDDTRPSLPWERRRSHRSWLSTAPQGECHRRLLWSSLVSVLAHAGRGPGVRPRCVDTAVPGPSGSAKPLRVWSFAAELVWQKKGNVCMYVCVAWLWF